MQHTTTHQSKAHTNSTAQAGNSVVTAMTTAKKIPTPRGRRAGSKVILVADSTAATTNPIAPPAHHKSGTGQNGNQLKNQSVHRHAGFCDSHEIGKGTRNLGTPLNFQERDLNFQEMYRPLCERNSYAHHKASAIIAPGAKHTISEASNLYVNEVFPCPEFNVLDVGNAYPQGRRQRFGAVLKPHVHSLDLSSQRMVFEIPEGIKAMKPTPTPTSGTSTHDHTSLSFVRIEHKGPRNQKITNWFSVPDEDYCAGNANGYKVASELLAWLQTRPATYDTGLIVREIMAAAFAVLAEPHTQGKTDKRGAAVTFSESMASFLMFAAQHSNHQAYLAGQAQRSETWAKESAQMDAERNRETGRRLAAARKAKREARMAESGRAAT